MPNDRRRPIEYLLIMTLLCGLAAPASGQRALDAGRAGPVDAGTPAAVAGAPAVAAASRKTSRPSVRARRFPVMTPGPRDGCPPGRPTSRTRRGRKRRSTMSDAVELYQAGRRTGARPRTAV